MDRTRRSRPPPTPRRPRCASGRRRRSRRRCPAGCPASRASATFGRTPSPSTTRSAGSSPAGRGDARRGPGRPRRRRWRRRRRRAPARCPRPRTASAMNAPMSGSKVPTGVAERSTTVTSQAADPARLGDLQADVAAADDDDPLHVPAVQLGAQRRAVVEDLHAVDARRVDARHRRAHRHAAGGVDEVVEGLGALAGRRRGRASAPSARSRSMPTTSVRIRTSMPAAPVLLGRAGDQRCLVARTAPLIQYGMPQAEYDVARPRSNMTTSRSGRRLRACDAALPPAASPPMTTTRVPTGSTLGHRRRRRLSPTRPPRPRAGRGGCGAAPARRSAGEVDLPRPGEGLSPGSDRTTLAP